MKNYSKSNNTIKKQNKIVEFLKPLYYYGLILLGSLFFASFVADIFEFSWIKGLLVAFIFGVISKQFEDLKDDNRLLEISLKEHLADIDQLENRIDDIEKFIKNEIRELWQ